MKLARFFAVILATISQNTPEFSNEFSKLNEGESPLGIDAKGLGEQLTNGIGSNKLPQLIKASIITSQQYAPEILVLEFDKNGEKRTDYLTAPTLCYILREYYKTHQINDAKTGKPIETNYLFFS